MAAEPSAGPPGPHAESAAAPAASTAEIAAAGAGWRSALSAWLQAHKGYPEAAREAGEQGRAVVRITIARDGHVLGVALVGSSGSTILDDAAQGMLRGATLPPLPAAMAEPQVTVTVPLRYTLEP